ncbi:PTS transporter subunit EIIC [Streptococcus alactolyticus]|uniref:PTS transporter subunit EIIC n=3 Tax=Lactobacillales TaxID=186826 RepID=A0A9D2G374_9LACT|nr:PTS transporter subunit EIIC [Candidatus Atopostipes pullistercoris]
MKQDVGELERNAERIVLYAGGAGNIIGISAGRHSLLSISVKHMSYVDKPSFIKMTFIDEVIFTNQEIVIHIEDIPAREVEIAIRLYDGENVIVNEEPDEIPESNLEKTFYYVQTIFIPLLPVLIGGGILQAIIILVYNLDFFSAFTMEQTSLSTLSGMVYNYLPVMIAFSSAKYHKANPYIAVTTASILMHPLITSFISDIILEKFLGFRLLSETYSNSILPILMIVPILGYIENHFKVKLPSSLKLILKPFLLLLAGLSLGIFLFRPLMTLLGNAIVALIELLHTVALWSVPTLLGLFGPAIVVTGAHYSLFPLVIDNIEAAGFDSILGPAMIAVNFAHAGVALAVILRTKNHNFRTYSIASFVMILFGVSQPTIFGIEIMLKKPFLYAMLGGGVGGLLAGIFKLKTYLLVNPSVASLFAFQDQGNNLLKTGIVILVSFLVAFLLTWKSAFLEPIDENFQLTSPYQDEI